LIRNATPPSLELYDLRRDPGERMNMAEVRPAQARELARKLERWRAAQPALAQQGAAAPDEEQIRRLKGLGYLGGDRDSAQ